MRHTIFKLPDSRGLLDSICFTPGTCTMTNSGESDFEYTRLDAEWVALNAVRELIHLASEGSGGTYKQALDLGAEICPALLGEDVSLIRQSRESDTAKFFKQKAKALRNQSTDAVLEITAVGLLEKEIADLNILLSSTAIEKHESSKLRARVAELKRARVELVPEEHTENELIFRDAYNVKRHLPELKSGKAYRDFELAKDTVLRVRVFHPGRPEHISGADMVYERHSNNGQFVTLLRFNIKSGKTNYFQ